MNYNGLRTCLHLRCPASSSNQFAIVHHQDPSSSLRRAEVTKWSTLVDILASWSSRAASLGLPARSPDSLGTRLSTSQLDPTGRSRYSINSPTVTDSQTDSPQIPDGIKVFPSRYCHQPLTVTWPRRDVSPAVTDRLSNRPHYKNRERPRMLDLSIQQILASSH